MALPFFYIANDNELPVIELEEETARHIVQVLRMKEGEQLHLTNGKGVLLLAEISATGKKYCAARVLKRTTYPAPERKVSIAISLLKNPSRFEWFLEKATEIGVSEIIPLICSRTEKEKFRLDRLQSICISAMLQSQQVNLPILHSPTDYQHLLETNTAIERLIAHCDGKIDQPVSHYLPLPAGQTLILIGPEGDFTREEINQALEKGFKAVSLGNTRLRSETAGVVAATLLASS